MLGAALLLSLAPPAPAAEILLLASEQSDAYLRFTAAFETELQETGGDGVRYTLDTIFLDDAPADLLPDLSRYALAVTIGTRAADALTAGDSRPGAVLYTLLPASVYRALETGTPACPAHSAILIDQPITRQLKLARILFPQARRVGILLGPTSRQRLPEIEHYRRAAGPELVIRTVAQEAELASVSTQLLDDSDLLLAVSDPLALNRENARWLLYAAYQRRLPVIGFSSAYVRAGAAAAVFSEPEQMARQAAGVVREWLANGRSCLPEPGYAHDFSVSINAAVYGSLGGKRSDEQAVTDELRAEELQ